MAQGNVDRPLILAVALAVVVFLGSLFALAAFVDGTARQREEIQAGHAMEGMVRLLAADFPGQLDWDEAIVNLDNRYDDVWAATNIGRYFCDTLQYDFVYGVGPADKTIFAMKSGVQVNPAEFAHLQPDGGELIQVLRAEEHARGPFVRPFKMYGGDISRPIQASAITRVGGEVFILTATLVQPNQGTALPLGSKAPLVVSGKAISPRLLQPIGEALQLEDLHLHDSGASGDASLDLKGLTGLPVATLDWTPARPGRQLAMIAFLPLLVVLCLPLWLYFQGRLTSRRLTDTVRELEAVSASVPGVIFSLVRGTDLSIAFPFVSQAVGEVTGLQSAMLAASARSFIDCVHQEDRRRLRVGLERSARTLGPFRGEVRFLHPTKGERWLDFNACPRPHADGGIVWFGFAADNTERKLAEAALQTAAALVANIAQEVVVTGPSGDVTSVNPAFSSARGYAATEALGMNLRHLLSPCHHPSFFDEVLRVATGGESWQGEMWNQHKDGSDHPKWATFSKVNDKKGRRMGFVATFADISALKATETRLEALSTLDPLTGLPNRRALHTRLGQALARAQLNQSQGAVMFLDLDRFKVVNDTLGHAAGDHLLRVLSHRFRARLREHDVIARMGGDEFVVVLDDLADLAQATRVAGELLAEVAKPVPIGAHREVTVGTSIGISVFPGDGLTVDELIRKADAALYLAKGARDGSYRYFHAAMTLTTAPEDDL